VVKVPELVPSKRHLSLAACVGKALVAHGGDNVDEMVILVFEDAFAVLRAHRGYEDASIEEEISHDYDDYAFALVRLGLLTQEQVDARNEAKEAARLEHIADYERRELERLKAKFEGSK
jgi:hypothetical protein